jgi:hypothetical protein
MKKLCTDPISETMLAIFKIPIILVRKFENKIIYMGFWNEPIRTNQ